MALKLPLNEPVELSLTRSDPKMYTKEGRTSMMYSILLPDGTEDKAFLTPSCSQTIQELQILPRQPFVLCRRKTPMGVEFFDVHTCAKSSPQPQTRQIPAASPSPAPRPMAQAGSSTGQTQGSSLMGAALIAAIDAANLAQEYAASKGLHLEFKPEDYRAIAATLYIQAAKDPLFHERVEKAA